MHRAKSRPARLQGAETAYDAYSDLSDGQQWGSASLDSGSAAQQQERQQQESITSVTVTLSSAGLANRPAITPTSIYDLYSVKHKAVLLLLVCLMSLIVPLSDTIYLPSLERVKQDLNCSQAMAALSVAVYMLGAGCLALIWGPLSDRFGRRTCYFCCCGAYIAATLGCMFAANITQLVAFRALQGGSVSGFMAGGAGVVADIFAPRQRGLASGIFSVPMLLGPVLGPLIGGAAAAAYGWRSCFVILAAYAAAALLAVVLLLRQETHQYYAVEQAQKTLGIPAARTFIEAPQILAQRPRFRPPWRPLALLVEWAILPYSLVKFILFGCMFATLIILPQQLALRQKTGSQSALAEHLAGLAYVPVAVGCFVAAPVGGKAADVGATRLTPCKQGRMVAGLAVAGVFMPSGLLAYGWTLSTRQHLAFVLLAHAFVGAAVGCYMPALFSYLSVEKQSQASAAASAVQAVNLVMAGLFIQTSALAVEKLGAGVYFSILAALALVAVLCTGTYTWRALKQSQGPYPHSLQQQQQHQQLQQQCGFAAAAAAASSKSGNGAVGIELPAQQQQQQQLAGCDLAMQGVQQLQLQQQAAAML